MESEHEHDWATIQDEGFFIGVVSRKIICVRCGKRKPLVEIEQPQNSHNDQVDKAAKDPK